jgi:hypothetical protein
VPIGETNNHGGIVDALGPVTHLTMPQQSKTFMSRELDYPLGTWWFPTDYAGMFVCNTTLTVADTNSGTGTYTTVPLGCIQIPMP